MRRSLNGEAASGSIQSVERALTILFLLADTEATLSVGEIADRLGVHISTASRLLGTLAQQNVVVATRNGYRLGLGLLRLSHIVLSELTIRTVAHDYLKRLSDDTGFSIYLGTLLNRDVLYLDQIAAEGKGLKENWIGLSIPAHTTSAGKVLLAYRSEEALTTYLAAGLAASSPKTITDPALLQQQLLFVREHGYATSQDEYIAGFSNVAAPIFDASSANIAVVSLSGRTTRLSSTRMNHDLAPLVVRTADAISTALAQLSEKGFSDEPEPTNPYGPADYRDAPAYQRAGQT